MQSAVCMLVLVDQLVAETVKLFLEGTVAVLGHWQSVKEELLESR